MDPSFPNFSSFFQSQNSDSENPQNSINLTIPTPQYPSNPNFMNSLNPNMPQPQYPNFFPFTQSGFYPVENTQFQPTQNSYFRPFHANVSGRGSSSMGDGSSDQGGNSDFPEYSTQEEEITPTPSLPKSKPRNVSTAWGIQEDMVLVSSFLNVSTDPIRGNSQKSSAYLQRFTEYYNMWKPTTSIMRSVEQVRGRWRRIDSNCRKFSGCYGAALRNQRSGTNENDVLRDARELFKAENGGAFTYDHCWMELRDKPQWIALVDQQFVKQKRSKINLVGDYNSSNPSTPASERDHLAEEENEILITDVECEPRPIGIKQAKRRGKKKVQEVDISIETLNIMRESRERKADSDKLKAEARLKMVEIAAKEAEIAAKVADNKQRELDYQIIFADTSNYTPEQLAFHAIQKREIMKRLDIEQ